MSALLRVPSAADIRRAMTDRGGAMQSPPQLRHREECAGKQTHINSEVFYEKANAQHD